MQIGLISEFSNSSSVGEYKVLLNILLYISYPPCLETFHVTHAIEDSYCLFETWYLRALFYLLHIYIYCSSSSCGI
jgi:hypothetical protein